MPRSTNPAAPAPGKQHADWLRLLPVDGPFLALPVLTEVFPHGLETIPDDTLARVRQAWAEVCQAPDLLAPAWTDLVLRELLAYSGPTLTEGAAVPAEFTAPASAGGGNLRPDAVAFGPDGTGGRAARLLVYRRPWEERLTRASKGESSPVEQAAEACRRTGVPLALVTSGRLWILVHARRGEPTSAATFDADLWLEERILLRAFATLLSTQRVLPPATRPDGTPTQSLAALFDRSASAQAEITDTLGRQVRAAVDLLVGELSRLDRESGGTLLDQVEARDIYRAALTVMMRLVFLLYAEEQRLLPIESELYADSYAISSLHRHLEDERSLYGEEVGDRRSAAWPRLLATFAALHDGSEHPDLRIPAYGGSLFDPDRYPWLADTKVSDRVAREILDALLVLRGKHGAEQLSYASLNVEQIGHVYEGLLEFSCLRVTEPYVGLAGKLEPELPLAQVEHAHGEGEAAFAAWLKDKAGFTAATLKKALAAEPTGDDLADLDAACDNDAALAERIRPFLGLLRRDLRGWPVVGPTGSVVLTQVGDRRATGTHYTPRALAEEVVEHTLAPLCYSPGPADGAEPDAWQVKKADQLLALRVADIAMGSGAFLVSACRYLAERVVQAWERDGLPADVRALVGEEADRDEWARTARRLVVDRCLYGVDRDPMAVELAKLSLWLVTLAKDKPFSFLDHALRHGDSLIGVTSIDQITAFHLNPEIGRRINARLHGDIEEDAARILARATEVRQDIAATPVIDIRQAQLKAQKLMYADDLTEKLRLAADAVVAAALSAAGQKANAYDDRLTGLSEEVHAALRGIAKAEETARQQIDGWLGGPRPEPTRPLHWPLEFPELFGPDGRGFDAIVGNPPFVGGQKITGSSGKDYRDYLVERIADGRTGSADLCAYFLLRDSDLVPAGRIGIIATNTIAQGDTREVGLDQSLEHGRTIYRAVKSQPWPGTASLEVSLLWLGRPGEIELRVLDGRPVRGITPSLDPVSRVNGNPRRLAANAGQSFQGSIVLGKGFILETKEARALIAKAARYADALFPYLNGEDLNSRMDCSASRWVINFHDWTETRAQEYPDLYAIIEEKVKPERAQNKRKARRERWWQYAERAPQLYRTIAGLDRVLAIALVSKTALPLWQPRGQVFSHALGVFATDRAANLTLLSSAHHYWWAITRSSSLKGDLRYTPSDVYETFPKPALTARMDEAGEELDCYRRSLMLERQLGLTKLYNQVHDPNVADPAVERLRQIHIKIDRVVNEAYGWTDLELGHGFHETWQGPRFTIAPDIKVEVLDRLLELNLARHAEEQGGGGRTKGSDAFIFDDGALLPPPDSLF
ncbi:Eco57I restriction-modification methylase domain-containing protein (plasmid) [Streptomyces sp. CA-142005]|uniref:Eco57I restriction-modification methylase domain-containing protein n=1 Tax=Streptomyces sp. CA-142005 TaxID=3240052 RepID=UPI003D9261A2